MSNSNMENALILLDSIRNALRKGVKHFTKNGEPLLNEKDIIESLLRDEEIMLEDPEITGN